MRLYFQDGKEKRYSYVCICIFPLLAVLEIKDTQEHVSLLHLLAMSKINKVLAQELITATCVIAGRVGHDKSADKCQRRDKVKKNTCLQLSITTTANKRYDC